MNETGHHLAPEARAPHARVLLITEDLGGLAFVVALQESFDVAFAHGGAAALRWLHTHVPAIVLLDTRLTDMPSSYVLFGLRTGHPQCPVVALTHADDHGAADDIARLGIQGLCRQPVQLGELAGHLIALAPSCQRAGKVDGRTPGAVQTFVAIVSREYATIRSLKPLTRRMNVSTSHLSSLCRTWLGMPPKDYLRRVRCAIARHLLLTCDAKLDTIAAQVGFYDAGHFCRVFRRLTGRPPGAYRENFAHRASHSAGVGS